MSIKHSNPNIQRDEDGVHSLFGSMFYDVGQFIYTTTLQPGETYIAAYVYGKLLKNVAYVSFRPHAKLQKMRYSNIIKLGSVDNSV